MKTLIVTLFLAFMQVAVAQTSNKFIGEWQGKSESFVNIGQEKYDHVVKTTIFTFDKNGTLTVNMSNEVNGKISNNVTTYTCIVKDDRIYLKTKYDTHFSKIKIYDSSSRRLYFYWENRFYDLTKL